MYDRFTHIIKMWTKVILKRRYAKDINFYKKKYVILLLCYFSITKKLCFELLEMLLILPSSYNKYNLKFDCFLFCPQAYNYLILSEIIQNNDIIQLQIHVIQMH